MASLSSPKMRVERFVLLLLLCQPIIHTIYLGKGAGSVPNQVSLGRGGSDPNQNSFGRINTTISDHSEPGISKFSRKLWKALVFWIVLATTLLSLFPQCNADNPKVVQVASYNPPYVPTACFGSDPNQIHAGEIFGAVSEELWEDGAACGKRVQMRCVSETYAKSCIPGRINVTMTDYMPAVRSKPSKLDADISIAFEGFRKISADPNADFVLGQIEEESKR